MRVRSVKALSRGGDAQQSGIHYLSGKLHEIRHFGPDQSGAHRLVGVQLYEYGAVERELAQIRLWHVLDSARGGPVGLEIGNQHRALRDHQTVDLAGNADGFSAEDKPADDRNFGPAAGREKFGESR